MIAEGAGCCGALNHHLGQDGHAFARANIMAWTREIETGGLDAIVINASGCGTTVKDYGFLFRDDQNLADKAAAIAALARDVTELMSEIGLEAPTQPTGRRVAYHSACSLQHGQQIRNEPKKLLKEAGFVVLDPPEGHLCCGSAGTYNLLQPEIATRLRGRKVANLESFSPEAIAAGNIGCITQIASGTAVPVCTRSNCSTGRPAARGRAISPRKAGRAAIARGLLDSAGGTFLPQCRFSPSPPDHQVWRSQTKWRKTMMALLWIWLIAAPAVVIYAESRSPLSPRRAVTQAPSSRA